jgi:hypothetical protein
MFLVFHGLSYVGCYSACAWVVVVNVLDSFGVTFPWCFTNVWAVLGAACWFADVLCALLCYVCVRVSSYWPCALCCFITVKLLLLYCEIVYGVVY